MEIKLTYEQWLFEEKYRRAIITEEIMRTNVTAAQERTRYDVEYLDLYASSMYQAYVNDFEFEVREGYSIFHKQILRQSPLSRSTQVNKATISYKYRILK